MQAQEEQRPSGTDEGDTGTIKRGPFWDFLNMELSYKAPWEHEEDLESPDLECHRNQTLPGNRKKGRRCWIWYLHSHEAGRECRHGSWSSQDVVGSGKQDRFLLLWTVLLQTLHECTSWFIWLEIVI